MRLGIRKTLFVALLLSITGLAIGTQSANASVASKTSHGIGTARPFSATGCTQDNICIDVEGAGLTVNTMRGDVDSSGGILNGLTWCGRLTYTISDMARTETFYSNVSPHGCANGPFGIFDFTETINASFPNNSLACVGAQTDSGRPSPGGPACLTIHN